MTHSPDEMTIERLATRLAEVEQELTLVRAERPALLNATARPVERPLKKAKNSNAEMVPTSRRTRRALLQQGVGAAVAAVGAGALLEASTETAFASGANEEVGPDKVGKFSSNKPDIPAITATGTNGAIGVSATSDTADGVYGSSNSSAGGVAGVVGVSNGTSSYCAGVAGYSNTGSGIGVYGSSSNGAGITGQSDSGNGVYGSSSNGTGVFGVTSGSGTAGVIGYSSKGSGTGVYGNSSNYNGIAGQSDSGNGVYGSSSSGNAGYFQGNVHVTGTLSKGGGSFKIDHPQDPAHKYLSHSFVESPDMKNIYDDVVTLDAHGQAEVALPGWFGTLNNDFRYQLTCLGGYAPVYIAEEISHNRFTIAGGKAGMRVSWQITGIRQDAWANQYRIPVEQEKSEQEQGRYLHPELYGLPKEDGIGYTRPVELTLPTRPG